MLESYIRTGDGKDYVDVDCVREALGIKEDENIFLAIKRERDLYRTEIDNLKDNIRIKNNALKTVKKERDELKDRVRSLRIQANSVYGAGCGYSEYTGDKAPAFLCNVISYSWNFGALDTPFSSQSIRVELELTPTANYNGTFDLEDLKHYIQAYGREKKLGIIESVDYQNAKAARAELAYLYKTVLGKDRLDRDLSPHEVMKAILDEYDKREDFIRELSCSLGFGNPVVKPDNIDQKEKDILERVEKLKDGVWPCENSSTFAEHLRKKFPKFCKEYDVAPLAKGGSIHYWLQYIFDVLTEYRELADKLVRLRSDICTALCLGCETYDEDILKTIRRTKEYHDALCDDLADLCEDYKELRKAIWEAMDRKPEKLPEENARLVGEVTELARGEKLLIEFRDAVAKAIGMDYPTTNQVILNNVQYIYKDRKDAYEIVSKLNDQVTALEKAKEDLQQMLIDSRYGGLRDSQRDLLGEYLREAKDVLGIDTCEKDTVTSAIKALKSAYEKIQKDYDELGETYSSVLKWNNSYAEVRRLLGLSADADADEMVNALDQLIVDRERCKRRYENWYSRYESEHKRANGEHKRAEKLSDEVKMWKRRCYSLENQNLTTENEQVGLQAVKNECRKLKEEKAKVIAALGQDIWDDCVK